MAIQDIITDILEREGWPKVTDRVSDRGGLTKGGITLKSYNAYLASRHEALITADVFKDITERQARDFLLTSIAGSFIRMSALDPALFEMMFDWATTSGPDDPVRALQNILNQFGEKLVTDGVYGQRTEDALVRVYGRLGVSQVRRKFAKNRIEFYIRLALDGDDVQAFMHLHPDAQLVNLLGWVRRGLQFL